MLMNTSDPWNFEVSPYDFTNAQFTIPQDAYAMAFDSVAPGIVQYAQSIATAGESIVSAVIRARSQLAMSDQQRQLVDLQIQRAQQGLPPLNVGAITGSGPQGITLTGPLLLGVIALAFLLLSRR